jgi:hypothetical protein
MDADCYSRDGIHPNARGYLRVCTVVADTLCRHCGLAVPAGALCTPEERQIASAAHAPSAPRRRTLPALPGLRASTPHRPVSGSPVAGIELGTD